MNGRSDADRRRCGHSHRAQARHGQVVDHSAQPVGDMTHTPHPGHHPSQRSYSAPPTHDHAHGKLRCKRQRRSLRVSFATRHIRSWITRRSRRRCSRSLPCRSRFDRPLTLWLMSMPALHWPVVSAIKYAEVAVEGAGGVGGDGGTAGDAVRETRWLVSLNLGDHAARATGGGSGSRSRGGDAAPCSAARPGT